MTCPTTDPVETFLFRANYWKGWGQVVQADPCAYCGGQGGTIDHIDPFYYDRKHATNWTGACRECNKWKGQLPLRLALLWVPTVRRYKGYREAFFR